ncbi:MAG: TIGR04283 family arsenosugar biosynthesis glycosyltransferase [Chromatiales bacterium]|jgi:rSAM/selenodomain-associated transferase 2
MTDVSDRGLERAETSPQLAVIIPTLNEAATLPGLLTQLRQQQQIDLEVILADGGSCDATPQTARDFAVRILTTQAGRGRQMNRGAAQTRAPLLLFLHADSTLSTPTQLAEAVQALQRAWQGSGHRRVGGHFRLRFARSRPGRDLVYRYYEAKSALNRAECTNGDQGFLLARDFFEQLGGFDESLGFLEDQRLAEKIRRQGQWITLPGELLTSARRFEVEGLARRLLLSAMIMTLHHIGMHDFFQRADSVYRRQDRTEKLRLGPFFTLIDSLNREAGGHIRRQRWLATGRYALGHLWQPCFFLDVVLHHHLGGERHWFLGCHDLALKPLVRFKPLHYLAAGVVWLVYQGLQRLIR